MTPPVISIVARSGTGKTTLLEKLIRELKARGYRVGAIKHDAHAFEIDHAGKDSWRFTQAGADTMLLAAADKIAMVKRTPEAAPTLTDLVALYCGDLDIVLTEGFRQSPFPKIEVCRHACGTALLCRDLVYDPTLIAVAADTPLLLDVPRFPLVDAVGLCDLLVARFLT